MSQYRPGRIGTLRRRFAAAVLGLVTSMAAMQTHAQWATPSVVGRDAVGGFTSVVADASGTTSGLTWTSQPTSTQTATQTELWSAHLGPTGTWVSNLVVPGLASPGYGQNSNIALDASGSALLTWQDSPSLWYAERPAGATSWNAPATFSTAAALFSGFPLTDMNARGDAVAAWAEGTAYYYAVKWAGGSWGPRTPMALTTTQPYSRLVKVKMGDSGDALLQWEGHSLTCQVRPAICRPTAVELNIARLAHSAASWQMSGALAGPQITGNPYTPSANLILDASGRAAAIYTSSTSVVAITQAGNSQSWTAPKTLLPASGTMLAAGDSAGRVTVVSVKTGEVVNGDLAAGTWSAPQPLAGYVVPSGTIYVAAVTPALAVGSNGAAVLSSGNFAAIRPTATAPWGAFAPLTSNALEQKTTRAVAVQDDGKAVVALSAFDRSTLQHRLFAIAGTSTGVADPVLPAPTNFTAVGKSTGAIAGSWTDNARGSPVSIERCTGVGCTDFVVVTALVYATTFTDYVPSGTYTYRVRSLGTTSGTTSSAYVITVATTLAPPPAPTNLTAVYTEPAVATLNWTNNASGTYAWMTTEYAVCQGVGCTAFTDRGFLSPSGSGQGRVSGTPGMTYTYKVRTATDQGVSNYSNPATVTLSSTVPAPSGIYARAVSSAQISVEFSTAYGPEYGTWLIGEIERCAGVGCTNFALVSTMANMPPWAFYNDTGLSPGTSYSYRFRVKTDLGYSLYSKVSTAVTLAGPVITIPAAPTSLSAVAARTSVTLTWVDNSSNEDTFQLERCQGSGCTAFALVQTLGPNVTTATDDFLQRGTNYRYRIRAVNAAGASTYSNEVAVKTR